MIYPKIVQGGNAIPIGDNLFLMKGRKHKNGGIDIGKDLEVEGGEVMQTSPNEIKVFSAQKFLGGESPAELILSGANPDRVFAAQEQYKDVHGINDDGTKKKAKVGGFWQRFVNFINRNKNDNTQTPVKGDDKKQYNMTNKENNASILGYVPSTGKRKKASMSKDLVIYSDGTTHYTTDNDYDENQVDWDKTNIYQGQRKLKNDYWSTTGLGALGRVAAGVTGSIINNATNRKYLGQMEELVNKMKAYQIPLTKLKTSYNINPQLAEIENALRIGKNDIDANTASSQVALARKRAATLNATLEKNKLHGQKENIETDLINKDRLQQAQTIAENIRNTQNVENQKLQMLADIVDKRSENATATTQNIVGSVVGGVDSILNGANTYAQMLAGLAKSPDGAKTIYSILGESQRKEKLKRKK